MRLIFLGFISMIVLLNVYVCARYTELITAIGMPIWFFRTAYAFFVVAFFASIFYQEALLTYPRLNACVTYALTLYLGLFIFSFVGFLLADVLILGGKIFPVPNGARLFLQKFYAHGFSIFIAALLLTCFGMWNAWQISVKEYDISIDKRGSSEKMSLVLLTDLHLGTSIRERELEKITARVNALSPDLVCIVGDLFDHATTPALMDAAAQSFLHLTAPLGTYYVFGNHEYYLGNEREAVRGIVDAGVRLLADESISIGGISIIGRKDATDVKRLPISELMQNIDRTEPVLLLDHQPRELKLAETAGVDLMLSGHTHAGQITPFDLLAGLFNEMLYGLRKSGRFHVVVSSGTGVWRFPIRVGSKNEIIKIHLTFNRD